MRCSHAAAVLLATAASAAMGERSISTKSLSLVQHKQVVTKKSIVLSLKNNTEPPVAQMEEFARAAAHDANKGLDIPQKVHQAMKMIRDHVHKVKKHCKETHGTDQKALEEAQGLIVDCGSDKEVSDSREKRSLHSDCRTREVDDANTKETNCNKYNTERKSTYANHPKCSLEHVDSNSDDNVKVFEACLRKFSVWWGIYAHYTKCHTARERHENRRKQCHKLQSEFETSSVTRERVCKCRSKHIKFLKDLHAGVELKEQDRKADWAGAVRIDCYFKLWDIQFQKQSKGTTKENKTQTLEKCDKLVIDTAHLNINPLNLSSAANCTDARKPCDPAWLKTEYESQRWYTKAKTQPCAQHLTTGDDWTLIMKIGKDNTFHYRSPYWTDTKLLNHGLPLSQAGNAKYKTFLEKPFRSIRMCVGAPTGNCVEHRFEKEWSNARTLFSSGYIREPKLDRNGILKIFAPKKGWYQDCPMQRPGFNIRCHDGNWARWGFCLNCQAQGCQNSDNNDADASIGVGLHGQATGNMGAGWTNYFASGPRTCSANSKKYANVWLFVKP